MSAPRALRFERLDVVPAGCFRDTAEHLLAAADRDLRGIAAEVLTTREAVPHDRRDVALVCSIDLYCTLRGLTPTKNLEAHRGEYVGSRWTVDELPAALAVTRPGLLAWATSLAASARAAAGDELVVGLVFGPEAVVTMRLKVLPALAAVLPLPTPAAAAREDGAA